MSRDWLDWALAALVALRASHHLWCAVASREAVYKHLRGYAEQYYGPARDGNEVRHRSVDLMIAAAVAYAAVRLVLR